jgi:thioesterase domain-containing protein
VARGLADSERPATTGRAERVVLQDVEDYLHQHIPLTAAMEVRVAAIDGEGVRLSAPLAPNINHRSTIFGGSASALAILAGWTQVHIRLREFGLTSRIVIQRNSMEYLLPIHGEFEAFCPSPPEAVWKRLVDGIRRRGRGRITLDVELFTEGDLAGTFSGAYVVMGEPVAPADEPAAS